MDKIEVGRLNKAFGVKGYIKVVAQNAFTSDLINCDVWFIQKGNDSIPYFVESIKEDPVLLVKFDDINSPEEAKVITGCPIFLKSDKISANVDDIENDFNKLKGFIVFHNGKKLGNIDRVEEFPQQHMAFVNFGKEELMIPLLPEFIAYINPADRTIEVSLPDGFIESQQ